MLPKNNEIRVEPTTRCNYNCSFCNHDKMERKKETMSFSLFKKLIVKVNNFSSQYDTVTFAGIGDPLLDKGLEKKIELACKLGYKTLTVTNGYLLSVDRFKSLQDAGLHSIRISFHGATPETYAKNHGVKEENFHKVSCNLFDIFSLSKKKTKILLTHLITPGINDTEKEINLYKKLWKKEADLKEIWIVHNWVDGFNYRELQKEKRLTCGRVFAGPLQIQVDGTVNACCFDWAGKLEFGDLKTKEVGEVYSSPSYKTLAIQHLSGLYFHDTICSRCDQRNVDRSGALIYSSKYKDVKDRVERTSTAYSKVS